MIDDTTTVTLLSYLLVGLVLIARWQVSDAGQPTPGSPRTPVPPVPRPALSLFPADATDADIRRAVDDVTSPAVHRSHR